MSSQPLSHWRCIQAVALDNAPSEPKSGCILDWNDGRSYTYAAPNEIALPGGTFRMGTDVQLIPSDREGPARNIDVGPFNIDQFEVSVGQFAVFVAGTGYETNAEKFKWSYVYDGFLSETERERVEQWVEGPI
jgi:formylglycine-generating enzyme required for sulfatase activity